MGVKNFKRLLIPMPKFIELNSELILVLGFGFGSTPGTQTQYIFFWGGKSTPNIHLIDLYKMIPNMCILLGFDLVFHLIIGQNWKKFLEKLSISLIKNICTKKFYYAPKPFIFPCRPVFPTATFVNHWAIVTGLFPETNGKRIWI